ncbi:hypothetical protein R5W23_003684 [Gemmata sp. JC673]|uniref:Zinc ribbon domain-containing protein n=1 Tax=Gemmata algarum TaxID=2975278 RepID=A0ABU5F3S3_9BACT|nr:hypothetical protein [Gemmata algarum]MDY3562222.1 hypothetical protein [Gemmata algarum]
MSDTCPHCGAKLPYVIDAFCPECRESLAEPSEVDHRPNVLPVAPSAGELPRSAVPRSVHTRLFVLAYYALAVSWGVRSVWFWLPSVLDVAIPVVFALCSGWWAVVDARRRGHPIPVLSRPWFFLLAVVVVPGYVIWSRRWYGVGWVALHAALGYSTAFAVMHIGGVIVFGRQWFRALGID